MRTALVFAVVAVAACAAVALADVGVGKKAAPRKVPAENRLRGQTTMSFFISPVGTGVAPPGPAYTLATLADVQSSAFVDWYNENALVDATEESFSTGCCIFGIADTDGSLVYWTYGGPDSSGASSYMATYAASGARQCSVQPTNPVYLGTAPDTGLYPNEFMSSLTTTMAAQFGTVSFVDADLCDDPPVVFGLWKPLPQFVVGVAGRGYTTPAGYQRSSLADVQSAAFASLYNANGGGLQYIAGAADCCCSFALDSDDINGIPNLGLVYGSSPDFSVLEPFYNNAAACFESLSSPVEFGTYNSGSYPDLSWGTLTSATQEMLSGYSVNLTSWCGGMTASFALFTAIPQYVVGPTGEDYPEPPEGYALAALADLQSLLFLNAYNNGGVPYVNPSGNAFYGCCVMSQADGFLLYDSSNVGPYTPTGSFECSNYPASPIWLGTANVGPDPREFIGQMTSAEASTFLSVNTTLNPQLGCGDDTNFFAIFKAVAAGSSPRKTGTKPNVARKEAVRAVDGANRV